MANVRISIHLPYLVVLPPGEYPTPGVGGSVCLADGLVTNPNGASEARSEVSSVFDPSDAAGSDTQARKRQSEADLLLRRVNRLLRWYRVVTGHAAVIELTRAQASPFRFAVDGTGATWGGDAALEYEAASLPLLAKDSCANFGDAVRQGLAGRKDPDVAALNVLDARYALSVGRFRESVLLCWAAIDSTFVRKFKGLVAARLKDHWKEGHDFLNGPNVGLRQKMTVGLLLLNCPPLHTRPENFWNKLSESYDLRNKIIHEGQVAQERDAEEAIKVAQEIVQIVAELPDS